MEQRTVVVAMSGGVDSSVAAALLSRAGHRVIGVTMRLWDGEDGPAFSRTCCSLDSIEDARRVCQVLGIPFYPLNLTREFQKYVIDYFCQEYQVGRTPNPCLACNRFVKFSFLLGRARALGADFLATGHYARVEFRDGRYHLLRALDPAKDQSYVLYTLGQEELARLLFPVGDYHKGEIRRLAQEWGLPVAQKPDSQEVCFVTEGDYRDFLADRVHFSPGPVVDQEGHELGSHRGLPFYTVGQRRGLGLALGQPYYVVGLDQPRNTLVVGPQEALEASALLAGEVSFVSGKLPQETVQVEAQIRYRSPAVPAVLSPVANGFRVDFAQPQRAVTPGQAVVFYLGEEVLGGGTIEAALRP
ncbi:MAG: tRNA 2-thiouridine(34) synthase MnmA [Dehalococcoidia bacterium]|nr:tRNA 2-thiouridine(34) synthase MnmA [Dehalococcoidia bacterium]